MPEALKRPEPVSEAPPKERKPAKPAKQPKPVKPVKEPKAAKPPKAAPAPKAAPKEGAPSKAFPVVLGVGALLAIVIGFVIGGSGGGSSSGGSGALTTSASAGGVAVKVPTGWQKMASAPSVPGLSIDQPVAFSPKGADGGPAVVLGTVKSAADNSTLLAAPFLQAIGSVPKPSPVQIGSENVQAYRYDNLKPKGFARPVTVYSAPTTAGVATVACVAPTGSTCDQIANTLTVSGGQPLPVGPSKDYAANVTKTLAALGSADKAGLAKLKTATTPQAQAAAASSLQSAFGTAGAALSSADVGPADRGANARLVGALKQTSAAYGKAASAAKGKNKAAFSKASGDVAKGRTALAGALAGLKAAGYSS
jgi:hypothetical protein